MSGVERKRDDRGRHEEEALWAAGLTIARTLADRGFEAYLVGGCVRDRLLGRPLHDVDIATSARPEEVAAAFARTIPTGLQHGTVTVLHEGRTFEVTTFRTESGYSDARRPDSVAFVSDLREDLARRDFTFNAMAFGLSGEYVDPFGGRQDLARRTIRCVGDASVRFGEDALRMVRAIRFASSFGFSLALSVWRGLLSQAPRLRHVAMERIGSEWDKMMEGADPERACLLLQRSGLLGHLKEPLPAKLAARRPHAVREGFRSLADIAESDLRWAAWLVRSGLTPGEASAVCRALRFSGKREARIAAVAAFDRQAGASPGDRDAFMLAALDAGRAAAEDWLKTRAQPEQGRAWLDAMAVHSVGQLAVRGDELARHLDKAPGPWVAPLLRRLLEATAFGRLNNDKETLKQAAKRLMPPE